MMIHEWRSYRLKPGATSAYLTMFADEGLPLVTRHLPLMGYWLGETGPLNTLYHLWSYADWSEREACRASLANETAWVEGFIPRAFALVDEQHTCLLATTATSPAFAQALARRRNRHHARSSDTALFAPACAGLVSGDAMEHSVAVWRVISGAPDGPVSLLPRAADPVLRDLGTEPIRHLILRPLAFSPL